MLPSAASVLLFLVADAADAPVGAAEPGSRSGASLSVVAARPAVLPGLALGLSVEVGRRIGGRPLFVALRLQWTHASAANESWVIDHHEVVAAAAVGLTTTLGAGRIWAEAGGGVMPLYEVLSRHQLERIQSAGVPGGTESAFSLGPYGFGEVGVALMLRHSVRGFVAAGPTLTRAVVDGGGSWRFGALGRVGVEYDF